MSEKVLSGACDNCPLRKKLDCDAAEVKQVQIVVEAATHEYDKEKFKHLQFALSDRPDDEFVRRVEIRPVDGQAYMDRADIARVHATEAAEATYVSTGHELIADYVRQVTIGDIAAKAESESRKATLAESFDECTGPAPDDTAWFRRKKCGANVVARVVSTEILRERDEIRQMLEKGYGVWTSPENLPKFKPIR